MKHYMKLNPDPFHLIAVKKKRLELRLNDEKRQEIKIGDEIEFTELSEAARKVTVKVTNMFYYSSFRELYADVDLNLLGYEPGTVHPSDYIDMLNYYSESQQRKYGVVGIEIMLE